MKTKTDNFFQNKHLFGGDIFHEGSKDVGILLIHGFTATTVEVGILAEHFREAGFTVSAPLLPGHGTSPYDLNHKRYLDWINKVTASFHQLQKSFSTILVGGESMGAVLTLYLAVKYPQIDAIYLFSPALLVKKLKYTFLMQHLNPIMDKNLPEDGLPWQGYTVYPTKAAYQFHKLTRLVRKSLSQVKSPTLIFQGRLDKTIDPENIDYIYRKISSNIKDTMWLDSSGHVLLLDNELSKIINRIEGFNTTNQIL